MARDLHREMRQQPRNGAAETAAIVDQALGEDVTREADREAPQAGPYDLAGSLPQRTAESGAPVARDPDLLTARRDWMLARVALMLIDAAKLLDPLTRIVVNRLMPPLSLAASAGICLYALMLTEGWQRVAVAGIFTALAALWIRRGMA